MKYRVIYAEGLPALTELVNGAIGEGWRPCGGITSYEYPVERTAFLQAMVKKTRNRQVADTMIDGRPRPKANPTKIYRKGL